MKSIKDIEVLAGKKILLRVDFNVPMKNGKVIDDFRIRKAVPTIEYLHKKGASIIILAHIGEDGKESLAPVAQVLQKLVEKVTFISTPLFSDETEKALQDIKKGQIILLENIRREKGEKDNAPSFARALSRFGDIYVNDAFSVSHRPHASIIGITKYLPGYAGLQMVDEVKHLSNAFTPDHPFLFILGGAKFETKIPLIKRFAKDADTIFVGGALASVFFRAKGYQTGVSLVEEGNFQIPQLMKNKNLILPRDVEVMKGAKHRMVKSDEVLVDENIVDIGPQSLSTLLDHVSKAKFILWNGPLGKYDVSDGDTSATILKAIIKSGAKNVIGGGDTVAYISKLKLHDKLGFVSTGGGATLDFLAKGTLAGIKVLK
jgi:phosphoglycerate kinase